MLSVCCVSSVTEEFCDSPHRREKEEKKTQKSSHSTDENSTKNKIQIGTNPSLFCFITSSLHAQTERFFV